MTEEYSVINLIRRINSFFCILFCFLLFTEKASYGQIVLNDSIECSWLEYDFGVHNVGETVYCTLIIKNISKHKLKIDHVINGCSCISTEVERATLKSNKQTAIKVKFNTEGKNTGETFQNFAVCTSDKKVYSFILKAFLQ